MINRAFIHITGQPGAGKTTLLEAALDALTHETAVCVHATRDDSLKRPKECAPDTDPHIRRYREAGAEQVALYRFPHRGDESIMDFYDTKVMAGYSSIIFFEGASPNGLPDLSAYVARPLPDGASLIEAGMRDNTAKHQRQLAEMEELARNPESFFQILALDFGDAMKTFLKKNPKTISDFQDDLRAKLEIFRSLPPPEPTPCRRIAESHQGIGKAGLVVVNIHDEAERERAQAMVEDVHRLRADKELFDEALGYGYYRLPITAVVANLTDADDAGRKKALARIKRAAKKGMQG
jgi:energy-coupling factor transporter ATP-binding protein EcfA2